VLLSSGLYATIDRVEEKCIFLKLGSNVVKARRTAVVALASEPAPEQN
jgi:preprotein translocase subunit YajC